MNTRASDQKLSLFPLLSSFESHHQACSLRWVFGLSNSSSSSGREGGWSYQEEDIRGCIQGSVMAMIESSIYFLNVIWVNMSHHRDVSGQRCSQMLMIFLPDARDPPSKPFCSICARPQYWRTRREEDTEIEELARDLIQSITRILFSSWHNALQCIAMSWVRMDKRESEIGYKQSFILLFAQRSIAFSYCKKRCHFLNYTWEIEQKLFDLISNIKIEWQKFSISSRGTRLK